MDKHNKPVMDSPMTKGNVTKERALVERDWILLFDSVEPLDRPLKEVKNKHNHSRKLYGYTTEELEKQKEYRIENKDKIREYQRSDKFREYRRKYRSKNKDKAEEYRKDYYLKNKERLQRYGRDYHHKNKEART